MGATVNLTIKNAASWTYNAIDYVPFLSTIKSVAVLALRVYVEISIYRQRINVAELSEESHFLRPIYKADLWRTFALLFPFFGNIPIGIIDFAKWVSKRPNTQDPVTVVAEPKEATKEEPVKRSDDFRLQYDRLLGKDLPFENLNIDQQAICKALFDQDLSQLKSLLESYRGRMIELEANGFSPLIAAYSSGYPEGVRAVMQAVKCDEGVLGTNLYLVSYYVMEKNINPAVFEVMLSELDGMDTDTFVASLELLIALNNPALLNSLMRFKENIAKVDFQKAIDEKFDSLILAGNYDLARVFHPHGAKSIWLPVALIQLCLKEDSTDVQRDLENAKKLIEMGASVNASGGDVYENKNSIQIAILKHKLDFVDLFLSKGAIPDITCLYASALHFRESISEGEFRIIQKIFTTFKKNYSVYSPETFFPEDTGLSAERRQVLVDILT